MWLAALTLSLWLSGDFRDPPKFDYDTALLRFLEGDWPAVVNPRLLAVAPMPREKE